MPDATQPIRSDLMWGFLRAFTWMDRALQENLAARGYAPLGGTESQIMFFVASGINRASEIARQLGISRQAIHKATTTLIERELIALEDDPRDRRGKVIVFRPEGRAQRLDAVEIIERLERELEARIGTRRLKNCASAIRQDWGDPPIFGRGE